jgi:hypothetical protein
MELAELRPGLWRWTARHPAAEPDPEPESPADWPPDVGCVAYEARDAFVLVDPLLPREREPFLAEMDARVRRHGRRVAILTTIHFHRRSREQLAARYRASTSRARAGLPQGVQVIPIPGAREFMVWLPEVRALIPGDRLLGAPGGLRMCPESWLGYLRNGMTLEGLREALSPLLDLPIELVLVSHGDPVLEGGREAIVRALA